jgi:hypothetical protein
MTQVSGTSAPARQANPGERLEELGKLCAAADLPAMLSRIGDIHQDWGSFSPPPQAEVLKIEAIFLSLLNARTRANTKTNA